MRKEINELMSHCCQGKQANEEVSVRLEFVLNCKIVKEAAEM